MSMEFGKLNFSVSFNPTSAFPLDARSYFESYDAAVAAAATADVAGSSTTTYYYGETIAVVENDIATLYTIQPDKTLSEVGAKVEINENVFAKDADGKLNLYGFADAVAGAQLLKGADGKLSWVKPDNTTIEGIQTIVAGLESDVESLTTTIGDKVEGTGLAGDIADLESSVTELETKIGDPASSDLGTDATGLYAELDKKANAADVYTKSEADSAIATAVAGADHLQRKKVNSVGEINPSEEGADKFIYMVAKSGVDGDHYDEYMVMDGAVERVGDWAVDLSEYAKTADVNTELEKKVDKVDGSRLMTDAEGTKLEGIEAGAQVNKIETVDEGQFAIDENKNLTLLDITMGKVTGLSDALDGKVDKVDGKGLSTNDLTDELLAKLNNADANVIEAVKLNGVALQVAADKSVDIIIPIATAEAAGTVKSSTGENKVAVAADGTMEVNSLNVNKLVQTPGEELILNGGSSAGSIA